MKPGRRDPLRELHQLVRVIERNAPNVGAFCSAHAGELAPALGCSADDLRACADLPDEVLVPQVRARLVRRRQLDLEREDLEDAELAMRAATTLGSTVRWSEYGAVLNTALLFGDVLADQKKKYISFVGSDFTMVVERETLQRTAWLRRVFIDVAAYVDTDGVHVRWRGGRGGYNWRPKVVAAGNEAHVLPVRLRAPNRLAVSRRGAWLGELLQEMGFAV